MSGGPAAPPIPGAPRSQPPPSIVRLWRYTYDRPVGPAPRLGSNNRIGSLIHAHENHHLSGAAGFKPHHRGHPGWAQETSVKAKQFPTGYFSQYHKIPIQEKEKVLAKIDATLKKLTQDGYGLIAKGAVIEKPDPGIQTYPQLTILDESGLVIIARQVPNLFYQYRGKAGINPNIYISSSSISSSRMPG